MTFFSSKNYVVSKYEFLKKEAGQRNSIQKKLTTYFRHLYTKTIKRWSEITLQRHFNEWKWCIRSVI